MADALSRIEGNAHLDVSPPQVDFAAMAHAQCSDPELSQMLQRFSGWLSKNCDENLRMCIIVNSKSPSKVRTCADSRRDFWTTNHKTAVSSPASSSLNLTEIPLSFADGSDTSTGIQRSFVQLPSAGLCLTPDTQCPTLGYVLHSASSRLDMSGPISTRTSGSGHNLAFTVRDLKSNDTHRPRCPPSCHPMPYLTKSTLTW